jgi:hypothetical protein
MFSPFSPSSPRLHEIEIRKKILDQSSDNEFSFDGRDSVDSPGPWSEGFIVSRDDDACRPQYLFLVLCSSSSRLGFSPLFRRETCSIEETKICILLKVNKTPGKCGEKISPRCVRADNNLRHRKRRNSRGF